jgi:hypothetical protein
MSQSTSQGACGDGNRQLAWRYAVQHLIVAIPPIAHSFYNLAE